jgi:AcrR family transcriptional regulator
MTERSVSRPEIIAALTEVFRERGYEGASLARLAAATGLKKASLYYHFPGGKEEMAEAVLDALAAWFTENMFAPLRGDEPLEARVQAMRAALDAHYGGGEKGCLFGLLAMGETRDRFASRTAAFFGAWIASLSAALIEAGFEDEDAVRRAADVVMEVEGALMLSRGLADTGPFQRVLRRLPAVLLGDARPAEAAVEAPREMAEEAPEPPEEAPEPPEPADEPMVESVAESTDEPTEEPKDEPEGEPKDPLDPATIEALLNVSATDEPAEEPVEAGIDAPPDAASDPPPDRPPDPIDEIVSGPPAGAGDDAGDDWVDEIPNDQDLAAMMADQTIGPIDSNEEEGLDPPVVEGDDPPDGSPDVFGAAGSDDEDTA